MDRWISRLLFLAACSSTALLAVIALFIFKEGVPIMAQSGLRRFLRGRAEDGYGYEHDADEGKPARHFFQS